MADSHHTPESRSSQDCSSQNSTSQNSSSQNSSLTILSHPVRQRGDYYSLNDLHEAAGGDPGHHPDRFLETPMAQGWVSNLAEGRARSRCADPALLQGGGSVSVFACREVAEAYALWVGSGFALAVLRAFGHRPRPGSPQWEPATRYDLGYVRDLRWDENRPGDIAWWEFDGQDGLTAEEAVGRGRDFFEQTRQLARINPGDAEMALKHSLLRLTERGFPGREFRYCEMAFYEWLSRAAVAWMDSSDCEAVPLAVD